MSKDEQLRCEFPHVDSVVAPPNTKVDRVDRVDSDLLDHMFPGRL